jgi:hypothetical protein
MSNIYAIDYGAYVDLIGTSKEPELSFLAGREGGDILVPFDDKRSIRRIVLMLLFSLENISQSSICQHPALTPMR